MSPEGEVAKLLAGFALGLVGFCVVAAVALRAQDQAGPTFYYVIEQPPEIIPTAFPISGIFVTITSPVSGTSQICTDYTSTDDSMHRTACVFTGEQFGRINLGRDKSDFVINSVSVTASDGAAKSISSPVPGVEY